MLVLLTVAAAVAAFVSSNTRLRLTQKHDIRTPEEGADTIVWLASTQSALQASPAEDQHMLERGGGFWFDRRIAPADFRWAGTRSTPAEFDALWRECAALCGGEVQLAVPRAAAPSVASDAR